MRAAPRKFSSDEALYTGALRALVRRAYSVYEMRLYLENRTEETAAAKRVLARLRQEKMIDDARYALDFARSRANLRRQGRHRIARELRRRGVPDLHIEAAVAQVFAETDEAALVRKVIERRMRAARKSDETRTPGAGEKADGFAAKIAVRKLADKKLASLYRTLMRAGFDAAVIRREVQNAMRSAAAPADFATGDFPDEEE
ncbi:MAG TPA: regulatory protein RecX [Candidatus Acidoferrales bacterium]